MVQWLVLEAKAGGVEVVDARDDSRWTPLIIAASAGHEAVVRLLVGAGADVNGRPELRVPKSAHRDKSMRRSANTNASSGGAPRETRGAPLTSRRASSASRTRS